MKSILLIRHAKSSWELNVEDFDRALNHRGAADAAAMVRRLIKKDIQIDAFISSPAKRAFTTATFFAEAYGKKSKNIITIPSLYEPETPVFYSVINDLNDDFKTVALFSHNNGITNFANQLTSVAIDDMPTCAIFAVKANIKKWTDFNDCTKQFWFFDYPKGV